MDLPSCKLCKLDWLGSNLEILKAIWTLSRASKHKFSLYCSKVWWVVMCKRPGGSLSIPHGHTTCRLFVLVMDKICVSQEFFPLFNDRFWEYSLPNDEPPWTIIGSSYWMILDVVYLLNECCHHYVSGSTIYGTSRMVRWGKSTTSFSCGEAEQWVRARMMGDPSEVRRISGGVFAKDGLWRINGQEQGITDNQWLAMT